MFLRKHITEAEHLIPANAGIPGIQLPEWNWQRTGMSVSRASQQLLTKRQFQTGYHTVFHAIALT